MTQIFIKFFLFFLFPVELNISEFYTDQRVFLYEFFKSVCVTFVHSFESVKVSNK